MRGKVGPAALREVTEALQVRVAEHRDDAGAWALLAQTSDRLGLALRAVRAEAEAAGARMDAATTPTPVRFNRLLPYWAVLQTDLRQTARSWVYRLWVLVTVLGDRHAAHEFTVREIQGVQAIDAFEAKRKTAQPWLAG